MVKVVKLVVGTGTLITGLALGPISARAADPPPLQGNVSTATVDIGVSPQALLNIPTGLNLPGLGALNGPLGKLSIKLDSSSAQGVLTGDAADLDTGHAVSQVVDTNVTGLDQVLNTLTGAINGVIAQLQAVPGVTGLTSVNDALTGLAGSVGAINLHKGAVADLAHGGTGVSNGSNVINNLTLPGGLSLSLAPYLATATNAATKLAGVPGPEAEAHSTTQSLAITPQLALPNVTSLVNQLLGTVNQLIGQLQTTVSSLSGQASGSAATVTSVLQSSGLPSTITAPVIGQVSGATSTGASAVQTASTALSNEIATLQGVLPQLTSLLNLQNLDLNQLIRAAGVTTSSLVEPSGGGVHGLATSKFSDISVLPLVSGPLTSLLGVAPSLPLLHIGGAQSTAEGRVDGRDTSAPTGSSKLGSIDVLGKPVIDLNTVISPGTTRTVPVDLGAFALTLQVTAGVPTISNSTATHKSVQVSALDISLLNGRPDGSGQIPLLGSGGTSLASTGILSHARLAASGSNAIVRASFASSAVDLAAGPLNSTNAAAPQTQGQLPKTGMLGPAAAGILAVLLAAGLSLRFIPSVSGRIRRSQQ